jgi:hypothetical protein
MTERDSGKGRLVSLDASQREYMVDFDLEITTEPTGERARFPPPRIVRKYSSSIKEEGKTIPNGEYVLKTSNETLRVRKTGRRWFVIRD